MTVSRQRAMRNTAGMLLALLALGVAWPSGAQAGCRDAHVPLLGRGDAHLNLLAQAGALTMPIADAVPPPPASPCAGMRCSNEPAPAPPLAPAPAPTAERWSHLAGRASGPDITSSPLICDDPVIRPRHRVVSPFHPPR